jgi:hypothetical protein
MARPIFGLDQPIKLGGGTITIREQWQRGKAREMRLGEGPTLVRKPLQHWVIIETEAAANPFNMAQYDISEADFKALRGESGRSRDAATSTES